MNTMEDEVLIQEKIEELEQETGHSWTHVNGFVAVTTAEITGPRTSKFKTGSGYPLKAFLNRDTGEIKFFKGRFFIDEES